MKDFISKILEIQNQETRKLVNNKHYMNVRILYKVINHRDLNLKKLVQSSMKMLRYVDLIIYYEINKKN